MSRWLGPKDSLRRREIWLLAGIVVGLLVIAAATPR